MSDPKKRTEAIVKSAEKAIAKITDPALRAKAAARLEATKKQIAKSKSASKRSQRRLDRVRDRDIER